MDTTEIISHLSKLSKKYHFVQEELIHKHNIHVNDARISVFTKCYYIVDSTYVFFLIRSRNLFDESWWASMIDQNLISREMTDPQQKTFIYGFDSFMTSSFLVMLLFAVESAFRLIYSATFAKNPPVNFSELYSGLLPEIGLSKYIELLKFASLMRNTLHSGHYIWKNDSVKWRDRTYYFEKGKSVKVNDVWHTLIMIAEDVCEMLEKVVKSAAILKKKEIIDASYTDVKDQLKFI